jgi:hypothetical protein
MNAKWKRQPELNLLRGCVLIVIAPLALRGTSCGQDFDFHLESWMEALRQWQQGVIYPHWVASANYLAGEPRFVFYPPFSWTLGAILGIFFPWTWVPIAFIVLCVLAMGLSFYKMACEWMPPHNAEIAACLYAISPYIFFVIYERSALAELLAAVWLPPLLLFALRRKPSTLQLSLTVAALWLTNAPAAVMGSYMLAVIAAVAAISQRTWKLVIRAACGMALGLGLAAIYIIPAVYEQRWVQIARAIMPGMRVQDSFLFEHTGMAYHDQVLRTASWIAVALVIATAIAAVLSYRARNPQPLRTPLIVVAALIVFLLFPTSKFIWNGIPELRFLQFPWRWMLVLGLILAVFVGTALPHAVLTRRTKILRFAVVLAVAAIFCVHAWRHFWLVCDDEDNVTAQIATLHDKGFEGTDEYAPIRTDNGDIQQDLAPIRVVDSPDADEADSSIEENPDWDPDMDDLIPAIVQVRRAQTQHITAEIHSPQPGYAILRLMDYPAWRVRLNNVLVTSRPHRDDGLITVPIPAGTSTIDVQYATTPDVLAGRIVSLVSLVVWLVLWLAMKFLPLRTQAGIDPDPREGHNSQRREGGEAACPRTVLP